MPVSIGHISNANGSLLVFLLEKLDRTLFYLEAMTSSFTHSSVIATQHQRQPRKRVTTQAFPSLATSRISPLASSICFIHLKITYCQDNPSSIFFHCCIVESALDTLELKRCQTLSPAQTIKPSHLIQNTSQISSICKLKKMSKLTVRLKDQKKEGVGEYIYMRY